MFNFNGAINYLTHVDIKGVMIGVGILVIFIGLWWILEKAKHKKEKAAEKEMAEQEAAAMAAMATPTAPQVNNTYPCKCGASFPTEKELKHHVFELSATEKGKHGKAAAQAITTVPVTPPKPKDAPAIISPNGKFNAYVWEPNPGIIPCKITKPVGTVWLAEPTLPKAGACYFCMKDANGNLVPYDPRLEPFDPGNSTEQLYRFIDAQEVVNPVYTNPMGLWEKINTIMPYVIAFLLLIAAIVKGSS